MYVRMGIVVILTLYSSRLLLQKLGVEDYGIFNLVGSIISMIGMLKTMFATATQRFLSFEIGRNRVEGLKTIFNMSIVVNVAISVLFFIVVEIIGFWFFEYQINIDFTRMEAAKWIFHLSVLSSIILICTSPYDALVIAHEKMSFYAFVSVFHNILNLIIIYLIPYLTDDNLISYGVLLFCVSLLVSGVTIFYCRRKFRECRISKTWNIETFKQMLSFAGWQLLGNSAYTLTQNGLNLVFNVFGGAVINAARGIAYQVFTALSQFLNNVTLAITPYTIKAVSAGNKENAMNMFYFSSKVLVLISICISIPLLYMTPLILKLWLKIVPPYTVQFVQLIILWSIVRSLHAPFDTLFKAFGDIKYYQIIEGIVLSCPLLVSYLLLKIGLSFNLAFAMIIIFEIINLLAIMFFAHYKIGIEIVKYIKEVIAHTILCLIIICVGYIYINKNIDLIKYKVCLIIVICALIVTYFFFFALQTIERDFIRGIIKVRKK